MTSVSMEVAQPRNKQQQIALAQEPPREQNLENNSPVIFSRAFQDARLHKMQRQSLVQRAAQQYGNKQIQQALTSLRKPQLPSVFRTIQRTCGCGQALPSPSTEEGQCSECRQKNQASPIERSSALTTGSSFSFNGAISQVVERAPQGPPGSSHYEDTADADSIQSAEPGVWEGTVDRREYIVTRRGNQKDIHNGQVAVRYDQNTCQVTLPVKVSFERPTDKTPITHKCPSASTSDDDAPPLEDAAFEELANRYITTVNERLNGWYSLQLQNCGNRPCAGRNIPIKVQVSRVNSDPDYTVYLANEKGRSCVSGDSVILYAQGRKADKGPISSGTLAHEGAHMVLGHGDEYEEQDESRGKRRERIRNNDWSLLSNHHAYGDWALLHERHFSFVPVFLNAVFPQCRARLVELARPTSLDLVISVTAGGYSGGGLTLGAGIDLGLPLDRLRRWQVLLGAHGNLLALDPANRTSLLLGMRVGMAHTFTPSAGGFQSELFGEGGAHLSLSGGGTNAPYVEGGGKIGYSLKPENAKILQLFVEAAVGTDLNVNDPQHQKWFRLGLGVGGKF